MRVAADEGDALVVRRIGAEIGAAFHAVEIVLFADKGRQRLPGPAERLFDLFARQPSAVDAAGEAVGEDCRTGGFTGGVLPVEDVAPVAFRILIPQQSFDVGPVDGQYLFIIPVAAGERVEHLARRPQGPAVAARPVGDADVGMRRVAGLPVEPRVGIEKQAVESDELVGGVAQEAFVARHIYEYSETIVDTPVHPVSDDRPSTVLESCRLWLNERGDLEPRENFKTSRTASGWGLYFYTLPEIEQLQADIHADLGTFYRSRRVQAWAPFALLSGAVNGHSYYMGNLADSLTPQPNLRVLARLNEPVGISVEMNQAREWYKEKTLYRPGGSYAKTVWVWNDTDRPQRLQLEVAVTDASGREVSVREARVEVAAGGAEAVVMTFVMPRREGVCLLKPRLVTPEGRCIEGVERRLMVARKAGPQTGVQGFGGHDEPFEGCRSVLENFIGQELQPGVQAKIVRALGGELVDRAEQRRKGGFLVRTTRYLGPGHMLVTARTFDAGGAELAAEQSEALTYVKLPEKVRQTIARVVGMIPVDESKIIRRRQHDTDVYTVTMVGKDVRYTIHMTPSGTLIKSEASGK